jgi:hypothetical protein
MADDDTEGKIHNIKRADTFIECVEFLYANTVRDEKVSNLKRKDNILFVVVTLNTKVNELIFKHKERTFIFWAERV